MCRRCGLKIINTKRDERSAPSYSVCRGVLCCNFTVVWLGSIIEWNVFSSTSTRWFFFWRQILRASLTPARNRIVQRKDPQKLCRSIRTITPNYIILSLVLSSPDSVWRYFVASFHDLVQSPLLLPVYCSSSGDLVNMSVVIIALRHVVDLFCVVRVATILHYCAQFNSIQFNSI